MLFRISKFLFQLVLVGPLFIDQSIPKNMSDVDKILGVQYGGFVEKGGRWEPKTCVPRKKVNWAQLFLKQWSQYVLSYQTCDLEVLHTKNDGGEYTVFYKRIKINKIYCRNK